MSASDLGPEAAASNTGDTRTDKEATWGDLALTTGLRVGGSIVGSVLGGLGASPTVVGIPAGVVMGGGAGAASGDLAAQAYEKWRGLRTGISPVQVAIEGATGMIPGGSAAKAGIKPALAAAGKGALLSGGAATAQSVMERGELPSAGEAAAAVGLGGAFGGVMHPIAVRMSNRGQRPPQGAPESIGNPPTQRSQAVAGMVTGGATVPEFAAIGQAVKETNRILKAKTRADFADKSLWDRTFKQTLASIHRQATGQDANLSGIDIAQVAAAPAKSPARAAGAGPVGSSASGPTSAAQSTVGAVPARATTPAVTGAVPQLPRDLRGGRPRFSIGQDSFEIEWASDLDKAAYITAQATPSKRDADYLKFVMDATGLSESEVRAYGRAIKDELKQMARELGPGNGPIKAPASLVPKTPEQPARPTGPILTSQPIGPDATAVEMRARARERDVINRQRQAEAQAARAESLGPKPVAMQVSDRPSVQVVGREAVDAWDRQFEQNQRDILEWNKRSREEPVVEVRLLTADDPLPPAEVPVEVDAPIAPRFEDLTWQERDEVRRVLTEIGPGTPTMKAIGSKSSSSKTVRTAIERYVEGKNTGTKLSPIVERVVQESRRRLRGESDRMFMPGVEGFTVYDGPVPLDIDNPGARAADPGTVDPDDILRAATEEPPTNITQQRLEAEGRPEVPGAPMTEEQKYRGIKLESFPEIVRDDLQKIVDENNGFEAQRRGVQTWKGHTEPQSEAIKVDLQRSLPRGTVLNAEELGAYANAVLSQQAKVRMLAEELAANPNDVRFLAQFNEAKAAVDVLLKSVYGSVSETGRAQNYWRAARRFLQSDEQQFYEELQKLPEFQKNAVEMAKAIAKVGADPVEQFKFLRDEARKRSSWWDVLKTYVYANYLSGPATHERNLLSNSINTLFGWGTDLVKGDTVGASGWARGARQAFFNGQPSEVAGELALPVAWRKAFQELRHGFHPERVAGGTKLDSVVPELRGGGANPFNWPHRALNAADVFFKEIIRKGEEYRWALKEAQKMAREAGTDDVESRMADLLANIPKDVQKDIDQVVLKGVYQETPGDFGRAIMTAQRKSGVIGLFNMPFVRVVLNLTRQGFEHTPAGFVMQGARSSGRVGELARARAAAGSIALMPIGWLAATGRITGSGPDDPGERQAWLASGKRPNSILNPITNEWVSYQQWQPMALPMSLVANAVESFQGVMSRSEDKRAAADAFNKYAGAIGETVLKTANSVLDQSFLSGLDTLRKAMDKPEQYQDRFFSQLVTGMMPLSGFTRTVTQMVDPTVRTPSPSEAPASVIPGLSGKAQPMLDRFGEEITTYGHPLMRGFYQASPAVDNELNRTLDRLGITPGRPDRTLRNPQTGTAFELTADEQTTLMKARGQARKAAYETGMRTSGFAGLPAAEQTSVLERIAQQYMSVVTALAQNEKLNGRPLVDPAILMRGLRR
ncbi:MAG: hypothetical protein AB7U20_07785 [Planctomycetaceae bacterium]